MTRNQREIIQLSKSHKKIFLKPKPPDGCGGNIDHYYHFVTDLVLPLYFLIQLTDETIFFLESFGLYTDRIIDLFSDRVRIISNPSLLQAERDIKTIDLYGMNPKCTKVKHIEIERFRKRIRDVYGIEADKIPRKIILVERLPPDEYFIKSAKVKGSGTSRRSILNHASLSDRLKSMTKDEYEFCNLQLEKLPWDKQIEYFHQACVVIAQHGAGLLNCIWI
ncbi:MAG: glycosyltransferase family 61 protein, partial [Cyanobacteria bacterium J06649_11]